MPPWPQREPKHRGFRCTKNAISSASKVRSLSLYSSVYARHSWQYQYSSGNSPSPRHSMCHARPHLSQSTAPPSSLRRQQTSHFIRCILRSYSAFHSSYATMTRFVGGMTEARSNAASSISPSHSSNGILLAQSAKMFAFPSIYSTSSSYFCRSRLQRSSFARYPAPLKM